MPFYRRRRSSYRSRSRFRPRPMSFRSGGGHRRQLIGLRRRAMAIPFAQTLRRGRSARSFEAHPYGGRRTLSFGDL